MIVDNHLGVLSVVRVGCVGVTDVVLSGGSGRTAWCGYASSGCNRADDLHGVGLVEEKDM